MKRNNFIRLSYMLCLFLCFPCFAIEGQRIHTMGKDPVFDFTMNSDSIFNETIKYLENEANNGFLYKDSLISLLRQDYMLYKQMLDSVIYSYNKINRMVYSGKRTHSYFTFIDQERYEFYKTILISDTSYKKTYLELHYNDITIKTPGDFKNKDIEEYLIYDSTFILGCENNVLDFINETEGTPHREKFFKEKKWWTNADTKMKRNGKKYLDNLYNLVAIIDSSKQNWLKLSAVLIKYYQFKNYPNDKIIIIMLHLIETRYRELNTINEGFRVAY